VSRFQRKPAQQQHRGASYRMAQLTTKSASRAPLRYSVTAAADAGPSRYARGGPCRHPISSTMPRIPAAMPIPITVHQSNGPSILPLWTGMELLGMPGTRCSVIVGGCPWASRIKGSAGRSAAAVGSRRVRRFGCRLQLRLSASCKANWRCSRSPVIAESVPVGLALPNL